MTRTSKLFGAAALLLLTACPLPRELRENPPPAVNGAYLVSVHELQRHLHDPGTVVLHVGVNRSVYDAGHIPGAHFLPVMALIAEGTGGGLPSAEALRAAFEAVGVSDLSHVAVYGDRVGPSTGRAFLALDYLGHPPAVIDGGLEAWRAEGLPVETAAPADVHGTLTPQVHSERLVDAEWVHTHGRDSLVALIDARQPEEYSGATAGEGVTRPGHLPYAHNLFGPNTIVSQSNPVLRSPEVLRALYHLAGARFASDVEVIPERPRYAPEDTSRAGRARRGQGRGRQPNQPRRPPAPKPTANTVVIYGRNGLDGSWTYFVARYLGYDAKLYEGGYLDWSARGNDFPVER
jgi:thiosulfate/3-mercaptopyruvate sulfurtransferase